MKIKKDVMLLSLLILFIILSGCLGGIWNNGETLSIDELRDDLTDSIDNELLVSFPNSSLDDLSIQNRQSPERRDPSYRLRSAFLKLLNSDVREFEVEQEHVKYDMEYELIVNASSEDVVEFLNASRSVEDWGNLSISPNNVKDSEVMIVAHYNEEPRIRFVEIFIDFSTRSNDYRSRTTLGFNPGNIHDSELLRGSL